MSLESVLRYPSRWAAKAAKLPALLLSAIAASFEIHELQVYFFSPNKHKEACTGKRRRAGGEGRNNERNILLLFLLWED